MSIYEHTLGSAFTRDPDYSEFLGKPYTGVIYDWTRRCWVRCVMQAPKTPKDAVTPVEGDELLAREKLPRTPRATAKLLPPAPPRIPPITRVVDLIRRYGPLTTKEIAMHMERTPEGVRTLMNRHEELFVAAGSVRVSRLLWATQWGLAGVHDAR